MIDATDNHIFNGYASCPDKSRVHNAHLVDNQRLWMQQSEQIIREFIQALSSFENFYEAYAFLAKKRHDVAVLLQHKSDEGKTDYYGVFRNEDSHFRQNISFGDGEHFWKWQKKKIFELTRALISPQCFFEDEYKTCLKESVTVDNMQGIYYCVTIKIPQNDEFRHMHQTNTLSTIELYEFVDRPNSDLIRIEYAPVNHDVMKGYYQILNHYYQRLLNWRREDGIEKYFVNAAKLSFLLAHILPIRQGNSAVVEWMVRAIAFKNGLEIGFFNLAEDISWDFKAILTPNQQDYIDWYVKKLFVGNALVDKKDASRLFTFKRPVSE